MESKRLEVSMIPWTFQNWMYCLYLHFIINNYYIEIIYDLGDKTIFMFKI